MYWIGAVDVAEAWLLRLAGLNLHALDKTILDAINVLHHLIEEHCAIQIANHLMDRHHGSSDLVSLKAHRFDMRDNQTPLPHPIGTHTAVSVDASAFHSIRPIHILIHGFEHRING